MSKKETTSIHILSEHGLWHAVPQSEFGFLGQKPMNSAVDRAHTPKDRKSLFQRTFRLTGLLCNHLAIFPLGCRYASLLLAAAVPRQGVDSRRERPALGGAGRSFTRRPVAPASPGNRQCALYPRRRSLRNGRVSVSVSVGPGDRESTGRRTRLHWHGRSPLSSPAPGRGAGIKTAQFQCILGLVTSICRLRWARRPRFHSRLTGTISHWKYTLYRAMLIPLQQIQQSIKQSSQKVTGPYLTLNHVSSILTVLFLEKSKLSNYIKLFYVPQ